MNETPTTPIAHTPPEVIEPQVALEPEEAAQLTLQFFRSVSELARNAGLTGDLMLAQSMEITALRATVRNLLTLLGATTADSETVTLLAASTELIRRKTARLLADMKGVVQ